MTYDHEVSRLHRADLEREIDDLRTERILTADAPAQPRVVERVRRRTGRALMAAGRRSPGPRVPGSRRAAPIVSRTDDGPHGRSGRRPGERLPSADDDHRDPALHR